MKDTTPDKESLPQPANRSISPDTTGICAAGPAGEPARPFGPGSHPEVVSGRMPCLTPDPRTDQRSVIAAPIAGRFITGWWIRVESATQVRVVRGRRLQPTVYSLFSTQPRDTALYLTASPAPAPHAKTACAEPLSLCAFVARSSLLALNLVILQATNAVLPELTSVVFSCRSPSQRSVVPGVIRFLRVSAPLREVAFVTSSWNSCFTAV